MSDNEIHIACTNRYYYSGGSRMWPHVGRDFVGGGVIIESAEC